MSKKQWEENKKFIEDENLNDYEDGSITQTFVKSLKESFKNNPDYPVYKQQETDKNM